MAAIGLKREGVDFQSIDGQPSRLFIMTLSPPDNAVAHIRFLGKLSRVLGVPDALEKLLATRTPGEVLGLLGRTDAG